MSKKERKKTSKKRGPVQDGPGSIKYLADITKESQMSVIAVYGDALDKLGFEIARKANRNAEKRLTKTLHVYDDMAHKNDAKFRKEKYELKEKLSKLRLNQQRVWREYATRGADEVGTTATGSLFRRARQLERSGVLEEEARAERKEEAELRAEAARRLVESRAEVDRAERVSSAVIREENCKSAQCQHTIGPNDDIEMELADGSKLSGAYWIDPEDEKFEEFCRENSVIGQSSSCSDFDVPDVVIDTPENCDLYENKHNCTEENSLVKELDELKVNGNLNRYELENSLQRMHTSPQVTGKTREIQSADPAKRPSRAATALPDIVVQSASSENGQYRSVEDESMINDHNQENEAVGNEKLLSRRKQQSHTNMIQPAYFRSQSARSRPLTASMTPPLLRQNLDKNSSERNSRKINVPAKIPQAHVENGTGTPKGDKKLTARLRRVSTPDPPTDPPAVTYSRSPSLSPAATPEDTAGSAEAGGPSNRENARKIKEKFLLESKLYVPKAAKNERRIIVPDKQEMLFILEEQKQELQTRIDRFLSRQIRRSQQE